MNDQWAVKDMHPKLIGNPCIRCGDLFYNPKTIIEDQKQRAAEWEDLCKQAEQERDQLKEELKAWHEVALDREKKLTVAVDALQWIIRGSYTGAEFVAREALSKIRDDS